MTSVLLFLFVGRLICVHTFIIFFVTIKAKQCMVFDKEVDWKLRYKFHEIGYNRQYRKRRFFNIYK